MKCKVWVTLLALLSLLSRGFALTTKESDAVEDNPTSQDEIQDDLADKVQQLVDSTRLKKHNVRQIESGTVKIRIQIPAADFETMFCVTRVRSPINHLAVAKCRYVNDQFFMYNFEAGTLQSFGAEDDGYWVPSLTMPAELQDQFNGKLPFVLNPSRPDAPVRWNVTVPSTRRITFFRDSSDSVVGFCMQTSASGLSINIFAKEMQSLWTGCSSLQVVTPEDDQMTGSIVQFYFDRSTREVVQECVTFDESAVVPTSALVLRDCVPDAVNQQFTYNIVTKRLRTAVNNAVLFFWWRGPIKGLEDVEDSDEGYGWTIPIRRPGTVVAVDDRGYSGACWSQHGDGNRVFAGQFCGTFTFLPIEDSYLYRTLSLQYFYQSVYVMTQSVDGVSQCLTIRRIPPSRKRRRLRANVQWNFYFSPCESRYYRLDQRFILTAPKWMGCSTESCQGILRWAGDFNVMVAPLDPLAYDMESDMRLVGASLSGHDYHFHFPYQQFDHLRVTRRDEIYQDRTVCLGYIHKHAILTDDFTKCPLLNVIPTSKLPPDSLDQVKIIERYDYRSMLALPNDERTKVNETARFATLQKDISEEFTDEFGRNYDYFIGDLGERGVRRFRVLGSGLHPQPSGELRANIRADKPNGISLPLNHHDVRVHPYICIDLYFRVNRDQIESRPRNSFLLMSFARSSGCVVYLTFTGKPGIRCYRTGSVFGSDQVLSWPHDLFDGRFHKVAVLYSTKSRTGFIQLYIDGQLIFDLERARKWSMLNTGESVAFFYDPYFWQFAPLPASLARASVVGAKNLTRIQEIATRKAVGFRRFHGDEDNIRKVPELETEWSGCVAIRGTGVHYKGLECTLTAKQDGEPVTVPQDVFSLGCSRPGCTITFTPNQPKLADSYRFIYRPNYPDGFVSENVGDPDLFQDPARITDGFKTETVSFGLKFSPASEAGKTVGENTDQDPSRLELGLVLPMNYICRQSCCVTVANMPASDSGATFG